MTRCVWWRIESIVFISSFLTLCAAIAPPQALFDLQAHNKHGRLGAVASENRVCSQIGIDLLQAGGNAADAVGECLPFLQALLTAAAAHWDHSVHWRNGSAIPPKIHCGRAEIPRLPS